MNNTLVILSIIATLTTYLVYNCYMLKKIKENMDDLN